MCEIPKNLGVQIGKLGIPYELLRVFHEILKLSEQVASKVIEFPAKFKDMG